MTTREFNFDGIVGPTHNYSGLSYGNVASTLQKNAPSNPRAAALQGLEKMRRVSTLGIGQAVLPPLRRPCLTFLRRVGMEGNDRQIIERAAATDPVLLAAAFSASNMWTANVATVSPSADCDDGRLHLTVANLTSNLHRSLESASTFRIMQFVFADERHFVVHPPLPAAQAFSDEGAANHTRLANRIDGPGLECFVYGRSAMRAESQLPHRFPARQTLEASQAIARLHQLAPARTVFVQQNPIAIDGGVFHNDVIAVGNQNTLLCHEQAFVDQAQTLDQLKQQFANECGGTLCVIQIAAKSFSLDDAVKSYFFNSQLLSRADGHMSLICPIECKELDSARCCIETTLDGDNPIDQVEYFDLRQSMLNGGGPACLRLRVVLTDSQQQAVHDGILFSEDLYQRLVQWVNAHYRQRLLPDDLRDPRLVEEVDSAMMELTEILQLPQDLL